MTEGRVLLVNTNLVKPPVGPVGLDYLGSALKNWGFTVDLLDLCFTQNFKQAIKNYFSNNQPDVVGVTIRNTDDCYLASQKTFMPTIKKIVDLLKSQANIPIVLGGCGFSIAPEAIMHYLKADFGIVGDGESSFPKLVIKIKESSDFSQIPGLIYWSENQLVLNQPQFVNLKNMVLSDRDTVDNLRYFSEGGMVGCETKRGCSSRCIYCADLIAKGSMYRLRSPEDVSDELENLVKKGIDHFHMCDSEFNRPLEHAFAVLKEIIKRRLNRRIKWYAYCAPVPFPEELAKLCRDSGCAGIDFGVDSGSDEMLQNLGRDFKASDLEKVAYLCHKYKIPFMFDLLLGGPGETEETITTTINLMKQLNPSRVGVSIGVRIYPSTYLASLVKKEGLSSQNPNLKGRIEGNKDFLQPIFYVSAQVKSDIFELVTKLVNGDKRFFFASAKEKEKNYDYTANKLLIQAIREGYRGAYWDILRRISD
jgi:radical SAM superfamily enzyme YgiQ (UPF0313 family)